MTLLSSANAWLIGPSSPNAATTAVAARRTGTAEATSAPNAISNTARVTGTDSASARARSLLAPSGVASAMLTQGEPACAAAIARGTAVLE